MKHQLLATFLVSMCAWACGSNSPSAPSPDSPSKSTTSLSFQSDPGDYIGQAQSHTYVLRDGTWNAKYDSFNGVQHVNISVTGLIGTNLGTDWWYLDFAAPKGQPLSVGTYENGRRYPFQPDLLPGLSFSGSGRGCNTLTGRFTVQSIALGVDNHVDQFQATFEQHCEGASPALRGSVSVFTNPWR